MSLGRALLVAGLLASLGCGYRSVHATPAGGLSVRVAESSVADMQIAVEVEQGLREALAKEGALVSGTRCPCVQLEITRVDYAAGSIVARGDRPTASSAITAVVGRARVLGQGQELLFETGDVRAQTLFTSAEASALSEALRGQDASRAAARRLGHLLGARLLGHPAATEESVAR